MTLNWYMTYDLEGVVRALRQDENHFPLEKMLTKMGLDIFYRTIFTSAALMAPSSTASFIETAGRAYSLSLKTDPSIYANAMNEAVSAGLNLLNKVERVASEMNPNYLTDLSNSIFNIMGLFEELQARG